MRNFLKLRGHRDFDYQPRYYKGEGNPYKIEHRLDKYRTTISNQRGFKNKFSNAFDDLKTAGDRHMKSRFLIALGILVLLFLYIIDFDLSIFLAS
ncbi:MAG: riboflavin synthase subunit beta [Bacteroidota bacterium]